MNDVRDIIKKEGRTARNLAKYILPNGNSHAQGDVTFNIENLNSFSNTNNSNFHSNHANYLNNFHKETKENSSFRETLRESNNNNNNHDRDRGRHQSQTIASYSRSKTNIDQIDTDDFISVKDKRSRHKKFGSSIKVKSGHENQIKKFGYRANRNKIISPRSKNDDSREFDHNHANGTPIDYSNSIISNSTSSNNLNLGLSNKKVKTWRKLFSKLKETLDEIYETCENDRSIDECKETILNLDAYAKDFKHLGELIALENNLQLQSPKGPVTWHIRKTTPVRLHNQSGGVDQHHEQNINLVKPRNSSSTSENGPIISKSLLSNSNWGDKNKTNQTQVIQIKPADSSEQIQHIANEPLKINSIEVDQTEKAVNVSDLNASGSCPENTSHGTFVVQTENSENNVSDQISSELIENISAINSPRSPRQPNGQTCKDQESPSADVLRNASSISWAELMNEYEADPDAQLEILRQPGGAAKIHEKLSSPSRRKRGMNDEDTRKNIEERHEKASERRKIIEEGKKEKSKQVDKRLTDVKEYHDQLAQQRLIALNEKLNRASDARNLHFETIKAKNQDEHEKVKDILFINNLESSIKQKEAKDKIKAAEDRTEAIIAYKEMQKEKLMMENNEREQAAEDRRKIKAEERLDWLRKLAEKKKDQEDRFCDEKQLKGNLQKQLAKEKEETWLARKPANAAAQYVPPSQWDSKEVDTTTESYTMGETAATPPSPMLRNVAPSGALHTSPAYEKQTVDCRGNTIDESTQGAWYKAVTDFPNKSQTSYHMPEETYMKKNAWAYCNSLGMEAVYLWCPKSEAEAESVWQHHPMQPLNGKLTEKGILMGVYRETNYLDDYFCAFNNQSVGAGKKQWYEPLYMIGQYMQFEFDYAGSYPRYYDSDNDVYTNDFLISWKDTTWRDFTWNVKNNNNQWREQAIVCEMNCDYLDAEPMDLTVYEDPSMSTHDDAPLPDCPDRPWNCDYCDLPGEGPYTRKKKSVSEFEDEIYMAGEDFDEDFDEFEEEIVPSHNHRSKRSLEETMEETNFEDDDYFQTSNSYIDTVGPVEEARSRQRRNSIDPVWGACWFPDVWEPDSPFEEVLYDCHGNLIPTPTFTTDHLGLDSEITEAIKWWRPKVPFYNKPNSVFHLPKMTTIKSAAFEYCQGLGVEAVTVWCPESKDEIDYLWTHHPTMSVRTYDIVAEGIWTGIFRKEGTFTDYYCASLDTSADPNTFSGEANMYNEGHEQVYQNWGDGFPQFRDFDGEDTRDISVAWDSAKFKDTNWNTVFHTGAVICEMNCTPYVTTTEEPPTTEAPVCADQVPDGTINVPAGPNENGMDVIMNNSPCDISPEEITEIESHGCHCWRLGSLAQFMEPLGGLNKIDALDETCNKWKQGRMCINLPGGECENVDLTGQTYQLIVNEGRVSLDCRNNSGCLKAACEIDVMYVEQIFAHVADLWANGETFSAFAANAQDCPKCMNCTPGSSCAGVSPDVTIGHD